MSTHQGRRGAFVVFEGGDGAGKSTQCRMLGQWLAEAGVSHRLTHEPGDTWLGQQVRRLVLGNDSGPISPRSEALLYAADKAQHVDEVVLPALERGEVVISDRYVDSTLAYQGAGRRVDPDGLERVARWATADLRPDLTVLLDVDLAQGVQAKADLDRLESAGADLHERARHLFCDLAAADPERYLVLPARDSRESIARRVRHRLQPLLAAAGLVAAGSASAGPDDGTPDDARTERVGPS